MQEQAAPPRFRGDYPHKLTIPIHYIPVDKFLRSAIWSNVEKGTLKISKLGMEGAFPKLVLQVKDPEILRLAGKDLANFDAIDCKDITCTCADKPRYEQLFAHTEANRDAIVYNNCKRTIFAAAKRQMKSAPVPSRAVVDEFLFFAKLKLLDLVGDDLDNFGYSFNQWFNHLTYAKQQRMAKVQEFLFGSSPLEKHYDGNPASVDEYCHYEAICKVEIQGPDGKPRMVCSIPDIIKYVMGPVCWKLEEVFQDKVPCYCGGKNLTQMQDHINEYIDEGFDIVAEGDGSAFDNTQDVLLKGLDRWVYERIADKVHHVPKDLFLHIANQFYKIMDVIATIDGKRVTLMTYAVLGTVFSGDCDTTLMNTLRMGMYNWFTNHKAHLTFGKEFVCFSKGDDFTVMYNIRLGEFNVADAYKKYWLSKAKPNGPSWDGCDERIYGLGQILKFIETGAPNSIKFCSLRAWYTDNCTQHIYLTRDPSKFTTLSKYSRKLCHMTCSDAAEYCIAQAQALETTYPGVEYFLTFAQVYREKARQYVLMSDNENVHRGNGRTIRDRRQTLLLEAGNKFDGYSYAPRRTSHKILENYWETMQLIERGHSFVLNEQQAALVNLQIAAEFNTQDLNYLVALRPN